MARQDNRDREERDSEFVDKLVHINRVAKVVKGGRFLCISSRVDKGQALQWLRDYYKTKLGESPVFIALGDSENDKPMLESADYAVLVRSTAHDLPEINSDKLIITNETGPLGWNNSLSTLLEKINHTDSG